jgi:hypothetical protein
MPDTDPLSDLRRQLAIAMGPTAAMRSTPWVDPLPMRKVLRDVQRHFDSIETPPREDTLRVAVRRFLKTGHVASFKELKYTCYGISVAVDEQESCLADQPEDLGRLLAHVDEQREEDRRFVRCYQALLQSYFAFTGADNESTTQLQAQPSFQVLRGFLSERLEVVARPIRGRVAGWAITLQEHRNLLGESPCQHYIDELAQGRTDQLAEVCKGLGIGRESWVWQEVILAYLRDVCQRDDRGFKQSLGQAIDLSDGKTVLTPSTATSRTVVAQLVKRYSEAVEKPELPRLRDASIHWIGNPWLRRPAWDGWVRHEPARQMVDGWLKSKLMEDFFTLLSEKTGGAVDRRRLTYWLKYVEVIEDMWFMLGSDAYLDQSAEFVQMRARMKGRLKPMSGSTQRQNNAFVMRIGNYLIVEFGSKGNACYFYHAERRAFDDSERAVSIVSLKLGTNRQSHSGDWEPKFDQVMRSLCGRDILLQRKQQPATSVRSVANSPSALSPPPVRPPAPVVPSVPPPAPTPSSAVPRETQAKLDLWAFLESCRKAGLTYRIDDFFPPVVWLSKDAIKVSHIATELAHQGFRYVEDPERVGFWHGAADTSSIPARPPQTTTQMHAQVPAAPVPIPKQACGSDMASFLAACRESGIDCRTVGSDGSVWLSKDAIKVKHVAVELAQRGFRYVENPARIGFWHGLNEDSSTPVKSPAQPVAASQSVAVQPPASPAAKLPSAPAMTSQQLKAQVQSLFERCKRIDLDHRDYSDHRLRVWIHKDAENWPTLERTLLATGFKLVDEAGSEGYWLGDPLPSRPEEPGEAVYSLDIAETLNTCDKLGIKWTDLRDRGGNLWVYIDKVTFSGVAKQLERQGFHFSEKKGAYWLPGDE